MPAALIVVFLLTAAIAVYARDTGRRGLAAVTKPLTTALLLPIVGWPTSGFEELIVVGILFSLAGDVVLLRDGNRPFLIGLVLFLVAHVAYIAAFAGVGHWSWRIVLYGLGMVFITSTMVRTVWAGAAGLRGPVIVYAATITAMVVAACATQGGALSEPASRLAILGAGLFYVSDSSLALDRFHRPIRHASVLTLGVYWLGQLGIALAARLGS
jgi:uncharacterized membrane protein YhhN